MNNQAEMNLKLQVKADIQAQPLRSQTYFSSIIDTRSRSEEIVLHSKGGGVWRSAFIDLWNEP